MSTTKKPKLQVLQLNLNVKKLFLEHSAKKYLKDEKLNLKFNKFMTISNSYLTTSRSFIKLVILIVYDDKKFRFHYAHCQKFNTGMEIKQYLTFDNFHKFNQLVKFKYFEMYERDFHKEGFQTLWSEMGNAKISLRIYDNDRETDDYVKIIEELKNQMVQLSWAAKNLIDPQMPPLSLETLVVKKWQKFDQVREILTKYTMKELRIYNDGRNPTTDKFDPIQFESFPYCPKLKNLTLTFWVENYLETFDSIMQILSYMPNLKRLKIKFDFFYGRDDAEHFHKTLFGIIEKVKEIQQKYKHLQIIKFKAEIGVDEKTYRESYDGIADKLKEIVPNYIKEWDGNTAPTWIKNDYVNEYEEVYNKWTDKNIDFDFEVQIKEKYTDDEESGEENEEE